VAQGTVTPSKGYIFTFAAELCLNIWLLACYTPCLKVRYNVEENRFASGSSPPTVLRVSQESRCEALRIYKLYFRHIVRHFPNLPHSNLDMIYLPRYLEIGYDETLRDFKSYLAMPEELNCIQMVALDHVNVVVKQPWEGYNKAVWIRSFAQLEQLTLVLCSQEATCKENAAGDTSVGNLEFVEPQEDPETMQCILEDFKRSFTQEQTIPVDYPSQEGPVVALPRLGARAKRVRGPMSRISEILPCVDLDDLTAAT
jgi:hypothetical protein